MKEYVISILMENNPGCLSRIVGLYTRRNFNIIGISAGETVNPNVSMITVVAMCDELSVEQLKNQLMKLEEVLEVSELKKGNRVQNM